MKDIKNYITEGKNGWQFDRGSIKQSSIISHISLYGFSVDDNLFISSITVILLILK